MKLELRRLSLEEDMGKAAGPRATVVSADALTPANKVASFAVQAQPARVSGKYRSLQDHLSARTNQEWRATFREVEAVLGTSLPKSARSHPAWWSNSTSHSHAHAWLGAGWRTSNLNITGETLSFVRSPATGT